MFAVILTYKKSMDEIERHTPAHRAFLDIYYAQGAFLLSGRQTPPKGGVILAKANTQQELASIFEQDPFYQEGIAEYEFIEFTAGKYQPCIAEWLNAPTNG